MSHHKLYSEFVSFVKYEVSIISAFWNFCVHTRNIKVLISKFEPAQQDRFSKKQNNMIEKSRYQGKPITFYRCNFTSTCNSHIVTVNSWVV